MGDIEKIDEGILEKCADTLEIIPLGRGSHSLEFASKVAAGVTGRDVDPRDIFYFTRFTNTEDIPTLQNLNKAERPLEGKHFIGVGGPELALTGQDLAMRILTAGYTTKRYGAASFKAFITEWPYDRQDADGFQKEKCWGQPNLVQFLAELAPVAGVDRIFTIDVHNAKATYNAFHTFMGERSFHDISTAAIYAEYLLHDSPLGVMGYLDNDGERVAFVPADGGNDKYMGDVWHATGLSNARELAIDKLRKIANSDAETALSTKIRRVSENFTTLDGLAAIFGDDKVDTGRTLRSGLGAMFRGTLQGLEGYGTPEHGIVYAGHSVHGGANYQSVQLGLAQDLPQVLEFVMTNTRPEVFYDLHPSFRKKAALLDLTRLVVDVILADALDLQLEGRYDRFGSLTEQHAFLSRLYQCKHHTRHSASYRAHRPEVFNRPNILS